MVSLIRLIPLKRNLYHFLLTICWLWVVGPISQEILVVITNTFYAIFHPILTSTPNFLKFELETQFFYYFQISIIDAKTFYMISLDLVLLKHFFVLVLSKDASHLNKT